MNEADLEALKTVGRLETLGVVVRSPELRAQSQQLIDFNERGGNRAIRRANERAARRAAKKSGADRTLRIGRARVRESRPIAPDPSPPKCSACEAELCQVTSLDGDGTKTAAWACTTLGCELWLSPQSQPQ